VSEAEERLLAVGDEPVDGWLELSPLVAAVDSLETFADFLGDAVSKPNKLRWAVIACHQATQDFMVATLAGSDGTGALTRTGPKKKKVQEYKKALWSGEPGVWPPDRALASFEELYESLKDGSEESEMRRYVDSEPFKPGPEDDKLIERLNELRGEFSHYKPGHLAIEVGYALDALRGALKVLRFLIHESPMITWYPDDRQPRAMTALQKADDALAKLFGDSRVDSKRATDSERLRTAADQVESGANACGGVRTACGQFTHRRSGFEPLIAHQISDSNLSPKRPEKYLAGELTPTCSD
jgi:hypothetical protein